MGRDHKQLFHWFENPQSTEAAQRNSSMLSYSAISRPSEVTNTVRLKAGQVMHKHYWNITIFWGTKD